MRSIITVLAALAVAVPASGKAAPFCRRCRRRRWCPRRGRSSKGPYQPQAMLPGGIVMPLYPAGSPFLNAKRVSEAEKYTMDPVVPGRVQRIVNIHNPSIEVHLAPAPTTPAPPSSWRRAAATATLVIGLEGADPVPYFFQYGINTIILRNRLRSDGYEPKTDGVYDIQQADPPGARPCRRMAHRSAQDRRDGLFRRRRADHGGGHPVSGVRSARTAATRSAGGRVARGPISSARSIRGRRCSRRPGPAKNGVPPIPKDAPPSFIAGAGWQDKVHAVWAIEYFAAMLNAGIPNVEMHIYARGTHGNGLDYRDFTAEGTWQDRFIHWLRDLGFFDKSGEPTLAAQDSAAFVKAPPKP